MCNICCCIRRIFGCNRCDRDHDDWRFNTAGCGVLIPGVPPRPCGTTSFIPESRRRMLIDPDSLPGRRGRDCGCGCGCGCRR